MSAAGDPLAREHASATLAQRDASVRVARDATLRVISDAQVVLDELRLRQRQLEELLGDLGDT